MDNKHYFSLYLIRIKHDLVLFSLLLTAIQSLIYLLLAIFSNKVTNAVSSHSHHLRDFFFLQYNLAQLVLEIVLFTVIVILSIVLMFLLQREKFFHAHVHLSCLSIWLLLTFFTIIPIILQEYTSVIRFTGTVTFSIIAIHTTLPIARPWTVLMASTTSLIHCIFLLGTHDIRDENNKSHRMEFKLEVTADLRFI